MKPDTLTESSYFNINELKQISTLLNELEYRRSLTGLFYDEINNYKLIIKEYGMALTESRSLNKTYLQIIAEITPEWWDKFYYGLTSGLFIGIIYLILN